MIEALSLSEPRPLLTCELADLKKVIHAVPLWSDHEARMLDQVLVGRVLNAIVGPSDVEYLELLYHFLRGMIPHARRDEFKGLAFDWRARWLGWASLLDARCAQLSSRDTERLMYRPGVPQILQAVREQPGISVTDVARKVEGTTVRAYNLVRVMVDHGLIQVRFVPTFGEMQVFPAEPGSSLETDEVERVP